MLDAANYYKTKKALRGYIGHPLLYRETSVFGEEYKADGVVRMVGPDAYRKRTWYATITLENGIIKDVK